MNGGVFDSIPEIFTKVEPGFMERNWWWIAALIFAAAAVGAFLALRKKSARELSPFELAQMRLDAAWGMADSKAYASAASSAVRDYISAVFGIPAPERTTEEFLKLAAGSEKLPDEAREKVAEILRHSDMAKFARQDFDTNARENMMSLARAFIAEDNARREGEKKK